MSFPLEEHSVLTSSLVEEGRVEGILIPKKMELTIPPTPFDEGGGIARSPYPQYAPRLLRFEYDESIPSEGRVGSCESHDPPALSLRLEINSRASDALQKP